MLPKLSQHPVLVVQENLQKLQHILRDNTDFEVELVANQYIDALVAVLWHSTSSAQYKAALPFIGLHVTSIHTNEGLQTCISTDIAKWIAFCMQHREYTEIYNRLFGQFAITVTKGMEIVFPELAGIQTVRICVLERNLITAVQMHLLGIDMSYEIAHIRKFLQTDYIAEGHSSLLLYYDLLHTDMQIVAKRQLSYKEHIVTPFIIISALAQLDAAHNHQSL